MYCLKYLVNILHGRWKYFSIIHFCKQYKRSFLRKYFPDHLFSAKQTRDSGERSKPNEPNNNSNSQTSTCTNSINHIRQKAVNSSRSTTPSKPPDGVMDEPPSHTLCSTDIFQQQTPIHQTITISKQEDWSSHKILKQSDPLAANSCF